MTREERNAWVFIILLAPVIFAIILIALIMAGRPIENLGSAIQLNLGWLTAAVVALIVRLIYLRR